MGKKRPARKPGQKPAKQPSITVPTFKKEGRTLEELEAEFKHYLQATIDLGQQSGIEISDGGIDYDKLLLRHGRIYQGRVLSDSIPSWKRWKAAKPQLRDCFCNAASFALDNNQARYCEGYWLGAMLPILHAWNMMDGQIIDFTLELAE